MADITAGSVKSKKKKKMKNTERNLKNRYYKAVIKWQIYASVTKAMK